jgi:hypothetical protein
MDLENCRKPGSCYILNYYPSVSLKVMCESLYLGENSWAMNWVETPIEVQARSSSEYKTRM